MKKLIFSLLLTMICSNITAQDDNHFKEVQYNPETGKFSRATKVACEQLTWNRKSKHDFHVKTPWFNNKKLEVNVSQLAHIIGMGLSIASANPRIKSANIPNCVGIPVPVADFNPCNVSAFLFCAYRFIAGPEKWPFKVIDQEETAA
jgi:hypothetical protein